MPAVPSAADAISVDFARTEPGRKGRPWLIRKAEKVPSTAKMKTATPSAVFHEPRQARQPRSAG